MRAPLTAREALDRHILDSGLGAPSASPFIYVAMSLEHLSSAQKGALYAVTCYLIWGMFPLYWAPLKGLIPADQLLAQRIVWSALFSALMVLSTGKLKNLRAVLGNPRLLFMLGGSAAAISINWLVYLWAVTNDHVLDASLGYFISPLFNVLLGRIFFSERLNTPQMGAVLLVLVGILWLAIPAGSIPWVALLLTLSFGAYGLIRKLAPLDALTGMAIETLLMLPVAAIYLIYQGYLNNLVSLGDLPTLPLMVMIGSGAATTVPLLFFAAAARRISLSNLGMIQYMSPTMQFLLGLLVFHESFQFSRFIGYVWVWGGVTLYLIGILVAQRTARAGKQTVDPSR